MATSLNALSYSSTNVTTSAYVTLIGSTLIPCSQIMITDTSGKLLKLAVGGVGAEIDLFQVPVSGTVVINLQALSVIPLGSRVSLKAIDATAATGYHVTTLIG